MIDVNPYALSQFAYLTMWRCVYVFAGAFIASAVYRYVAKERITLTTATLFGLLTAGFASGPVQLYGMLTKTPNMEILSWAVAALAAIPGRTYGDAFGDRLLETRWVEVKPTVKTYQIPEAERIGDIPGEPPAPQEVKERIAGRIYEFPRGIPKDEIERIIKRDLEREDGVGKAIVKVRGDELDVKIAGAEASITHTLPPDTVAVAVEPVGGTSHVGGGDRVDVYAGGRKICTAEVWRKRGKSVVLVMDPEDADEVAKAITQGKPVTVVVLPEG